MTSKKRGYFLYYCGCAFSAPLLGFSFRCRHHDKQLAFIDQNPGAAGVFVGLTKWQLANLYRIKTRTINVRLPKKMVEQIYG